MNYWTRELPAAVSGHVVTGYHNRIYQLVYNFTKLMS